MKSWISCAGLVLLARKSMFHQETLRLNPIQTLVVITYSVRAWNC